MHLGRGGGRRLKPSPSYGDSQWARRVHRRDWRRAEGAKITESNKNPITLLKRHQDPKTLHSRLCCRDTTEERGDLKRDGSRNLQQNAPSELIPAPSAPPAPKRRDKSLLEASFVKLRWGSGPGAIKQKVPPVTRSTSERLRTISAFRFFARAHARHLFLLACLPAALQVLSVTFELWARLVSERNEGLDRK
ncbi:hypothetical protein Q8A73_007474 [Channa argus]|nr:hypothetical protein Q8A73_007474 [Channa argus]